jgi:hypothetical protein
MTKSMTYVKYLTPSQRIALKSAFEIGQIERSNSTDGGLGRKHHWKTIDSLESKGMVKYINRWSAILTDQGVMIAEALSEASKSIQKEVTDYFANDR